MIAAGARCVAALVVALAAAAGASAQGDETTFAGRGEEEWRALLESPVGRVRWCAVRALGAIRPVGDATIEALIDHLDDALLDASLEVVADDVRGAAITALAGFGAAAEGALAAGVAEGDLLRSSGCALALQLRGRDEPEAVVRSDGELARLLEEADLPTRRVAAAQLLARQPGHARARRQLRVALVAGDEETFRDACRLLVPVDDATVAELLAPALAESSSPARRLVAAVELLDRVPGDPVAASLLHVAIERAQATGSEPWNGSDPQLVAALEADDVKTRLDAAADLLSRDPCSRHAIGVAVAALAETAGRRGVENPLERLPTIGRRELRAALAVGCDSKQWAARHAAATLAVRRVPEASFGWWTLRELMATPDPEWARRIAEEVADALGDAPDAIVREVTEWFGDETIDAAVRLRIAAAVAGSDSFFAPHFEEARARTTACLESTLAAVEPTDRAAAAQALLVADPGSDGAVAVLLELLRIDDNALRIQAVYALQHADERVLARLVALALDHAVAVEVRKWAAYTIGCRAGLATHAMRRLLREGDDASREWVVRGTIEWSAGEEAQEERAQRDARTRRPAAPPVPKAAARAELVTLLSGLLRDRQKIVALAAARTLVEIDRNGGTWPAAMEAAIAVLDACDDADRETCVDLCGRLGDAIGEDEPGLRGDWCARLEKRVRTTSRLESNRQDCARVLALSSGCAGTLVTLLADPDRDVAIQAAWALGLVVDHGGIEKAAAALAAALPTAEPWVRFNVAGSLLRLERKQAAARAALAALAAGGDAALAELARARLEEERNKNAK